MKRTAIIITLLLANPLWALTFMGPPTSDLRRDQTRFGIDYTTGEYDVDLSGPASLSDVDHDALFVRLGTAPIKYVELFGLLGVADVADSGDDFAWGVGVKGTVFRSETTQWGFLFQLTHVEGDDTRGSGITWAQEDFDIYEYQIAIGPNYRDGILSIYGGPFLHFIDGDLERKTVTQTLSFNIEEESQIGAYIGLSATIGEAVNLAFEVQATPDAHAFGLSGNIKF